MVKKFRTVVVLPLFPRGGGGINCKEAEENSRENVKVLYLGRNVSHR